MTTTRQGAPLTAYYFVLAKELEGEIEVFARRCAPKSCFLYKDEPGAVTIAFSKGDDAELFMNLYDHDIRDEYKVTGDAAAIDAAA